MDIPITSRTALVPLLAASGLLLAGCSDSELTADDIVERVATAEREAPSLTFEWIVPGDASGEIRTEGAIRYDDAGEVDLMQVVTTDEFGETEESRLVDGTLYHREGESGEFTVLQGGEAQNLIGLWDWASAAESFDTPEAVEKTGEDEVDGVSTTRYEVVFAESVQTWWVDDDDYLRRMQVAGPPTDDTGDDDDSRDLTSEGYLRDFGEELNVAVPDGVADGS